MNVACIVARFKYGIDLLQLSQINLELLLSPGGVKSKLALSAALASKNVSMVSASVSETLKVRLYDFGFWFKEKLKRCS